MRSKPLVSVIINCLNGEEYAGEAIRSVYAQDMDDWEIVFYDNHSTDRTGEFARSFDDKVKYFRGERTVPLGHARNLAIEKARGKYLAFLDSDDLCLPPRLRKQVTSMESASSRRPTGLCHSDSMRIDSDGKDLVKYSYDRDLCGGDVFLKLIKDCFIDMSACMITSEAFRRVGGFDLKYNQVEDWDMWLRIARHYDAAFVDEVLIKTRIHPGNESRNFSEHHTEKKDLIRGLKAETSEEREAIEASLRNLEVREHIATLIGVRGQSLSKLLSTAYSTAMVCAKNPRITAEIFAQYGNPKMIQIFLQKYFLANKQEVL